MSKTIRRYTDSMLGRRQFYKSIGGDKEKSFLAYLREQLHNAYGYKATNFRVISCKYKNKNYVLCLHDGIGFDNFEHIENSLYPSTSCGTTGLQGNGGSLSGSLLVNKNSDFEHIVISKCLDGTTSAASLNIDGRSPVVKNVSRDIIPFVNKIIDDESIKWNVCYMTCYQNSNVKEAIQNFKMMNQICIVTKSVIDDNKFSINYSSSIILDPDAKESPEKGIFNSISKAFKAGSLGGNYSNVRVLSFNQYCNLFSPPKYRAKLPFNSVKINTSDSEYMIISGNLNLYGFPGLNRYRSDSKSASYGLIPFNFTNGKAVHQCQPMEYSTYIVLNCFKDEASKRMCSDPVYMGKNHVSIGMKLGISPTNGVKKYFDFDNFSEFTTTLNINSQTSKDASQQDNLSRKPFVIATFEITSMEIFEGVDKLNISDSELRIASIGGLDEFFYSLNNDKCRKIIDAVSTEVGSSNSKELETIRENFKILFPVDNSEFCSLKVEYGKNLPSLNFVEKEGKKLTYGETYFGDLQYSDGTSVDPQSYVVPDNNGYMLKYIGDEWILKIKPLSIENGDVISAVSEKEWKEAWTTRLPKNRNYPDLNGVKYELYPRFKVPKSVSRPNSIGAKAFLDKKESENGRSNKMFQSFGNNPEWYISYDPKQGVYLNKDNQTIITRFRNTSGQQPLRDRLWEEIRLKCTEGFFIARNYDLNKLSDEGRRLIEQPGNWGEDRPGYEYFMNKFIEHLFTHKAARAIETKLNELYQTDDSANKELSNLEE